MTKIDNDSAVYCPECGKKLNEPVAQSSESPVNFRPNPPTNNSVTPTPPPIINNPPANNQGVENIPIRVNPPINNQGMNSNPIPTPVNNPKTNSSPVPIPVNNQQMNRSPIPMPANNPAVNQPAEGNGNIPMMNNTPPEVKPGFVLPQTKEKNSTAAVIILIASLVVMLLIIVGILLFKGISELSKEDFKLNIGQDNPTANLDDIENTDDEDFEFVGMKYDDAVKAIEDSGRTVGLEYYIYGDKYEKDYICYEEFSDDGKQVYLYISIGELNKTLDELKQTSTTITRYGVSIDISDIFYLQILDCETNDEFYCNAVDYDCSDHICVTNYDERLDDYTEDYINELLVNGDFYFTSTSECKDYKKFKIDGHDAISYSFTATDEDGEPFTETDYYVMLDNQTVEFDFIDYSGEYKDYFETAAKSIRVTE